jgi:hypothetical protein
MSDPFDGKPDHRFAFPMVPGGRIVDPGGAIGVVKPSTRGHWQRPGMRTIYRWQGRIETGGDPSRLPRDLPTPRAPQDGKGELPHCWQCDSRGQADFQADFQLDFLR